MPPQKSIASFFARTAPKPASGEALGPSASSPVQQSQQTAKAKAAAGSSKEQLVASVKAAPADQVGVRLHGVVQGVCCRMGAAQLSSCSMQCGKEALRAVAAQVSAGSKGGCAVSSWLCSLNVISHVRSSMR